MTRYVVPVVISLGPHPLIEVAEPPESELADKIATESIRVTLIFYVRGRRQRGLVMCALTRATQADIVPLAVPRTGA